MHRRTVLLTLSCVTVAAAASRTCAAEPQDSKARQDASSPSQAKDQQTSAGAKNQVITRPNASETSADRSGDASSSTLAAYGSYFAAGLSLLGTGFVAWRTWVLEAAKNKWNRELEEVKIQAAERIKALESSLAIEKTRADARIEYEWAARQRLFAEVEPILFLTGEIVQSTIGRLFSLAAAASRDRLKGNSSWLRGPVNYYLVTTAFRLLRPVACLRLMNEKLTQTDFSLDRSVLHVFVLAKLYREILTDPFLLIDHPPALVYDYVVPHGQNGDYSVCDERHQYIQHLYTDELDTAVDALVVYDNEHLKLKRYGEFRTELGDSTKDTFDRFRSTLLILRNFSPDSRPVLWRMLLACTLISKILLDVLADRKSRDGASELSQRIDAEADAAWTRKLLWKETADSALRDELLACAAALKLQIEEPISHIRLDAA
jgi:hypothetical protein